MPKYRLRAASLALLLLLVTVPPFAPPGAGASTVDVIPPPAPPGLTARLGDGAGTVTLSWLTATVDVPPRVDVLANTLSTPRQSARVVATADAVVIVGGADNGTAVGDVLRLDPASGALTSLGSVHPAGDASVAWDGSRVVVAGGCGIVECPARNVTFSYPDGSVETTKVQAPKGSWRAGVFWHAGRMHLVGGEGCGGPCNAVRAFDPVTGGVSTVASLPHPLREAAVAWTGQVAYVFGGWAPGGLAERDRVLAYDAAAGTLTTLDVRLPTPRAGAAAIWDGRSVYVFGGHDGTQHLDDVLRFDPASGTIERVASLPTPRSHVGAAWFAGATYLAGGETPLGETAELLRFTHALEPVPVRVDAHRVYRAAEGDATATLVATLAGEARGFTDTPPFGSLWRYEVAAVTDGEEGARSLASVVLPVPAPANVHTATGPGFGDVSLSWQPPALVPGVMTDTGARLAVPRWEAEAVYAEGRVVIVGGVASVPPVIETFDPATGVVSQSLHVVQRATGQAVWDGERVDVIGGGCGASCAILRYDPVTDSLETSPLAHPPSDRWMMAARSGDEVVVFGGNCNCRNVTRLDFAAGTSVSERLLPTAFDTASVASVGDDIYLLGGFNKTRLTTIHRYDGEAGTVETLTARLPIGLSNAQAFSTDGRYIHLVGGTDAASEWRRILRFDVQTGATHVEDLLLPNLHQFALASDGERAWIVGGLIPGGGGVSDVIYEYTPARLVASVEAYRVYAGPDEASLAMVAELPGDRHAFVHSGLGSDATRVYRVVAVVHGVESLASAPVVGETFRTPEPPVNLRTTTSTGPGHILVQWDASPNTHGFTVTGYKLYAGNTSDESTPLATLGSFTRSYTHKVGGDGTVRHYRVAAISAAGEGQASAPVRGITAYAPSGVQNLTASAPEPQRILVSWAPPLDSGGVEVYRYDVTVQEEGKSNKTYSLTNGETSFLDLTSHSAVRTYTVVPMNAASKRGPPLSVVGRALSAPSAPQNLTSSTDFIAGTVTLRWETPETDGGSPITGYTILRSRPGSITVVFHAAADARTFTDNSLAAATYYEYRVLANNRIGSSPAAGPVCGGVCP